MNTITVKVKNSEKERLSAIAMRYGLTLPELAKKVLSEVREQFELESLNDYENPAEIRKALKSALSDYKKGRFLTKL